MPAIARAVAAGFIATVVMSLLMLIIDKSGYLPQFDLISVLDELGAHGPFAGWSAHFLIGTALWSTLFIMVEPYLPGSPCWMKGVVFGVGVWLAVMLIVTPLLVEGFFLRQFGISGSLKMLVLHLVYGGVLGWAYSMLRSRARSDFSFQ